MKRFLVLTCALFLCLALVGCGVNRREGVVNSVITKLDEAANKVAAIKAKTTEAVNKAEQDKAAIDFTDALKAVSELREVGKQMREEKRDADEIKDRITPEELQRLAEKIKVPLNKALDRLKVETKELNEVLALAEKTPNYKKDVDDLRTKIREAEGEFETLTRR
jgi:DNA repair ATPase RecN